MRWTKPQKNEGDTRIKTFFAFLPVIIWTDAHIEVRWFERVTVEQVLRYSWSESYWNNLRFIDKETELTENETTNESVTFDSNGIIHHRV